MATKWPADKVERRPVADLIAYARNARTHTSEQVAAVAASIKEWGWTTPVLIDEDGQIIAGHCRVQAAQKLKLAEVPVMVARGWSGAQKRAYVIADNQLAISGSGWDGALLKVELDDLVSLDFDLELLGFGDKELSDILGDGISIAGEEPDGAASGMGAGEFLKFDKQKIPLTEKEIEALNGLVSRYVEIFGLAHGFARWLIDGKHLA
ncbi:MAG TPA: ParB/Srx family N-terminal domain-containing protein [Roseiarcus sp.]|nr:ParB/Srx family N-terminal domain-containing protein [Roseiarcus sp.]